jgi:hypothetical protein
MSLDEMLTEIETLQNVALDGLYEEVGFVCSVKKGKRAWRGFTVGSYSGKPSYLPAKPNQEDAVESVLVRLRKDALAEGVA